MSSQSSSRRRRYALSRLRLVNFHNFVDETVCVADAGHLFLLGDNASGKTTLLDALHLAFSGGDGVELNAAARVGGRGGEGRSLAGIVLRHDAERGVRNVGGAVAYAVVELRSQDAEARPLCLGLGMEATTMDAGVSRWGLLTQRSLDELVLVEADEQGRLCPLGRDELKQRLERREVFGRITDYRRAVAERLFAGAADYEDVCRFWSMAKAYREIVARARDFESLFTRLLPAPEAGVFSEILRSLRELSELGVQLESLREQMAYVNSLLETCRTIALRREERARYEWLLTHLELEAEAAALAGLEREEGQRTRRIAQLSAEIDLHRAALDRADANLREAEAEGGGDLFEKLERARRELYERHASRAQREQETQEAVRLFEIARTYLREAREAWAQLLEGWREQASKAATTTSEMPNELSALSRFGDEVGSLSSELRDQAALGDPTRTVHVPPEVESELRELELQLRERERAASNGVALTREALDQAQAELARARSAGEKGPAVAGLARALEALLELGIEATPLYLALEPRRDALALHVAALEVLAGDATLGALYVDEPDRARAADVLARIAPELRLFVREAEDATLPDWASRLLKAPASAAAQAAHAALTSALAQPASLGEVTPPDALAALQQRGLGFRLSRELPRQLGAEARARERRRRIAGAEDRAAQSGRELELAEDRLSGAEAVTQRLTKLQAAVHAIMAKPILAASERSHGARRELEHRRERMVEAQAAEREAALSEARAEEVHAALDARARELGLEALRHRLEQLRTSRTQAAQRLEDHQGELGGERALLARVAREKVEHEAARERLRRELGERSEALRAQCDEVLESEEVLAHYVLVRQRGQQFSRRENVQDRIEQVKRDHDRRVTELSGDGSGGVRHVGWAARFGFGWDAADNTLRDRRGEPAESVLAELTRTVADQESVIHEGTQQLMERLIMGSLLRHLREQVSSLDRLVRDINRLLADLRFGRTRYQFRVTPRSERKEIVDTVQKVSLLDDASRARFRAFVEDRMDELRRADDDGTVPELLDYRLWYDYRLMMRTQGDDDVELSSELRRLGSGGEQGVPNYLLVLALAKLMFDSAKARVRPLFFDEAFYGIDFMRRDELLRFATELGLQIIVASPDQDGVTRAVDRSTTLFVLKDELGDVHLAPYDYENHGREAQPSLFDQGPDESPAEDARCVLDE